MPSSLRRFDVPDAFHGAADQVEQRRGVPRGARELDRPLDRLGVGAEERDGQLPRPQTVADELGGDGGQQVFEREPEGFERVDDPVEVDARLDRGDDPG
jgi:hypothetical protein